MTPRLPAWLLVLLLALLSACAAPGQPADPDLARAACGLDPSQPASGGRMGNGDLGWPIDLACARHLGDDLHIDWDSFGREPSAVTRPADSADALLTGAWVLLAADHGTVGELWEDPLAPTWAGQALADEAERVAIADEAPASDLLYAWVTSRIQRVEAAQTPAGTTAVYMPATATIQADPDATGITVPPWSASVLVHETAHQATPGHDRCADPALTAGCDPDMDGPYGLQAWIVYRYAERLTAQGEADLNACLDARSILRTVCAMIADTGGSELCSTEPAC